METLDEFECLLADGFEEALIGRTSGFNVVAVYDYELCVHILTEQDMTAEEAIEFMEPDDIAFAKISQKSLVTGTTMPSGLKIPTRGNLWRIVNNYAIMDYGY